MLASVAMVSCVDTVILPDNKTVDDDFWQKKSEVDAVVSTAYAQLRDETAIRNMIVWGDFRSDELNMTTGLPTGAAYRTALQQIYSLNIETENAFTSWYPFYSAINYCNLVLEKAENVIAVDPDYTRGDYEANKAQALALRAFCYFYLTKVFHDIPVTPGAYMNSSADLNAPQATPDSVLTMCIRDLEEASKNAIPGNTYGDWRDKGYLNKDGINAVLADIYLWRASVNRDAADYQKCVDYCDAIIKAKKQAYEESGQRRRWGEDDVEKDYYLSDYDDMYSDLFGQNGQNADESIFELQFRNSNAANRGLDQMYFRYNNASSNSYGYLKAAPLYGTVKSDGSGIWFNNVDQRLYEYLYDATSSSVEQFGVRKFVATVSAGVSNAADSHRDTRSNMLQNWILYRLTEIMLFRAEAEIELAYNLENPDQEAEEEPEQEQTDDENVDDEQDNDNSEGDESSDDTEGTRMRKSSAMVYGNSLMTPEELKEDAFNLISAVYCRSNPVVLNQSKDKFAPTMPQTYAAFHKLLMNERRREFLFEGKRFFDLVRASRRAGNTQELREALSTKFSEAGPAVAIKLIQMGFMYMPVFKDEMKINPALVQNECYLDEDENKKQ